MYGPVYLIIGLLTAIIGKNLHGSNWWALADFIWWPLVWLKWIYYQEVNLTLVVTSFDWFFH